MIKRIKLTKMVVVTICLFAFLLPSTGVSAVVYTYPRADSDMKSVINTTSLLSKSTTLTVDTPIITNCSVRSSGYSWFQFNANGTGCTRTFISHSINVKSGGIGVISLTLSASPQVTIIGSSGDRTYSFTTDRVDYTINQSIWRLYFYNETDESSNYLKKSNGQIYSTVMNSTYISW
jgi:hypothetical protein